VHGAGAEAPLQSGTEVFKNDEVRVWSLDGEVLIASITAKLHLISPSVVEGLLKGVELAEQSYQGLVIWSPDDVFSAGANLEALMPVFMKSGGKGILPEVKEKLFNPFFTTKPAGEGTGLGLSISHDIIVKQHGGSIEVDTQPGEFTEFRIVLPRASASLMKSGEPA